MTTIALTVGDGTLPFECREVHGEERLGEPSRFDLVAFSAQAVAIDDVLGQPCSIRIENEHVGRTVAGVITRLSVVATTNPTAGRNFIPESKTGGGTAPGLGPCGIRRFIALGLTPPMPLGQAA